MIRIAIAAASLFLAVPAWAQAAPVEPAPLSLQQSTALRCSAAFALGAALQNRGEATTWPPLAARGREFFVRALARLMDDAGLTRDRRDNPLRPRRGCRTWRHWASTSSS